MNNNFVEAYRNATYKLDGHGTYQVKILKDALNTIDSDTKIDFYGTGPMINDFEDKMADLLGKEKAVFFPSGTMAQQIALRMWCDKKKIYRVAYHPLCHLEIYEEDGLKELHHIETVLLGEEDRLFTIHDLKEMNNAISTLLIELPQRGIGGQLPTWQELKEITDYCKVKGIRTHLDGARLWETMPYYEKELKEICQLFDSVYVSFYKGIGGVAGAILAGPESFMEESKIWKRRHGGDLISLYPYIVSAEYYLDKRLDKMSIYYEQARELAQYFNKLNKAYTEPEVPVSNMFHVYFHDHKNKVEETLSNVMEKYSLGITPYLIEVEGGCKFELNIGDNYSEIPKERLNNCFSDLNKEL
ncbi:threonine aldolase family protein [Vallitalea okinawensis]|uniref:threonine aldolase family protein n=1 Tax=Vallitalea okinawensis TaxID=2078660 RepID=UPI000CFD4EF5|nr:beta-eliminating lyase-related protein [Vallitalea okinawensis]